MVNFRDEWLFRESSFWDCFLNVDYNETGKKLSLTISSNPTPPVFPTGPVKTDQTPFQYFIDSLDIAIRIIVSERVGCIHHDPAGISDGAGKNRSDSIPLFIDPLTIAIRNVVSERVGCIHHDPAGISDGAGKN